MSKANLEAILVHTHEHPTILIDKGGSHAWKVEIANAELCRYAVMRLNRKHKLFDPAKCALPHNTVHLVGEIDQFVPSLDVPGRHVIKFKRYALIDCTVQLKLGQGHRYKSLAWLAARGIDIDDLDFVQLPFTPSMES